MNSLTKAKEELTLALEKLEEAVSDKINRIRQTSAENHGEGDEIKNCYNEINNLQKEVSKLGMENEDLRIENHELLKTKDKALDIAVQIKYDLSLVKSIINKK